MALRYKYGKKGAYGDRQFVNTTATTYAAGDALKLASGKLAPIAAATDLIAGVAEVGVTAAVANSTAAILVPNPDMIFSVQTDDASAAAIAQVGKYANMTVTSGSMKVDHTTYAAASSSANTGTGVITTLQLVIVGVDSDDPTGTSYLVSIWNGQLVR